MRLDDFVRGAVMGRGLSCVGWSAEKDVPLDIAESSSMVEEDPSDGRDMVTSVGKVWYLALT